MNNSSCCLQFTFGLALTYDLDLYSILFTCLNCEMQNNGSMESNHSLDPIDNAVLVCTQTVSGQWSMHYWSLPTHSNET